ncbi:isochorismatase family protein [Colwellia piezophila]|uniref:isochorismatase family protein n=1 Tax=Colwellia piezophila TaxID=211668 RepID=UPI00035E8982|nr:isochorismatase family protein [Colwellia piezophila]
MSSQQNQLNQRRQLRPLTNENTGLIVVDVQGNLAHRVHDSASLIANCATLIKGAQALGLPIIWLEQNPEKLGATVSELSTLLSAQSPIIKFSFNAGAEPKFISAINQAVTHANTNENSVAAKGTANIDSKIDNWLMCDIEAHICVYQTAQHLQQSGFNVQLVQDCISSRTLANKTLAINKLSQSGAELTGLEMCLYELVKDCREPAFKDILALIR